MQGQGELALYAVLAHQVYLVASLRIAHLHRHSRLYLHAVPVDECHSADVVVVPVVEQEGDGGGPSRVEGTHDA